MIGIYKITSPSKRVYIGQSINIEKRFISYKKLKSENQIKLHRSFLKHGVDKHVFTIICECEVLELNDKERYYQDLYSVIGEKGLNCKLTKSSDRNGENSKESNLKNSLSNTGKVVSKETRLKLSLIHKGRIRTKEHSINISKSKSGIKASEETKIKMSKARTGKTHTHESKQKMCLSQKDHFVSEETKQKISATLSGRKASYETRLKKSKIVICTQTGIFFYSVNEASVALNINRNTLKSKLIGNTKNNTSLIYA